MLLKMSKFCSLPRVPVMRNKVEVAEPPVVYKLVKLWYCENVGPCTTTRPRAELPRVKLMSRSMVKLVDG